MKKVIILTGSELRHSFFRKSVALSDDVEVVNSYCENSEKDIHATILVQDGHDLRDKHLMNRGQSEKDFFGLFVNHVPDNSRPIFLSKGAINSSSCVEAIIRSQPDLLVAYGCSIVKEPLINAFPGRFFNVHLGLSPYYRGSGTNYWPLVNGEPEYVGVTFMHINRGVDTGEIIHQIRSRIMWGDTPSQIGNRLIADMAFVCREIIRNFDILKRVRPLPKPKRELVYKKDDFSEVSVATLYNNFRNGLVESYLSKMEILCDEVPIISNPVLKINGSL